MKFEKLEKLYLYYNEFKEIDVISNFNFKELKNLKFNDISSLNKKK